MKNSTKILPLFKSYILTNQLEEAITILIQNISYISFHINTKQIEYLLNHKEKSPTLSILLSYIFYIKEDYEKAATLYLEAGEQINTENEIYDLIEDKQLVEFYLEAIHNRVIESYTKKNKFLRDKIFKSKFIPLMLKSNDAILSEFLINFDLKLIKTMAEIEGRESFFYCCLIRVIDQHILHMTENIFKVNDKVTISDHYSKSNFENLKKEFYNDIVKVNETNDCTAKEGDKSLESDINPLEKATTLLEGKKVGNDYDDPFIKPTFNKLINSLLSQEQRTKLLPKNSEDNYLVTNNIRIILECLVLLKEYHKITLIMFCIFFYDQGLCLELLFYLKECYPKSIKGLICLFALTEEKLNTVNDETIKEEIKALLVYLFDENPHDEFAHPLDSNSKANKEDEKQTYLKIIVNILEHSREYTKLSLKDILENISTVFILLTTDIKQKVFLDLLAGNNQTNFSFLSSLIKPLLRSSSLHIPVVYACTFMNMGTSNDTFFRTNQDFIFQSKHFNRYISHLSLGIIHCNNVNAREVMKNLLPNETEMTDGGICLGLALSEKDPMFIEVLMNFVDSVQVQQQFNVGNCLGLGLLASDNIVEKLMELLKNEEETKGFGAAVSIGMILIGRCGEKENKNGFKLFEQSKTNMITDKYEEMCIIKSESEQQCEGSKDSDEESEPETIFIELEIQNKLIEGDFREQTLNNELVDKHLNDILDIAKKTIHNKLTCGVGIALALSNIGIGKLTAITRKLLLERNEMLRYAGCLALGCAFVGTLDEECIQLLLKFINDSSADVKRGAVFGLGLALCGNLDMLYEVLEPLALSHSTAIRGAVALTLGFFFSGKPSSTVCNVLEVLLYDSDSLVRQAACIGMGFMLVQINIKVAKRYGINYKRITERINYLTTDRSNNNSCCMGAVLGRALMESGGRNVVFSVYNLYGKLCPNKVMGAVLMMQYWHDWSFFAFVILCHLPTFNFVLDKHTLELKGNNNDETQDDKLQYSNSQNKDSISTNDSLERGSIYTLESRDEHLEGVLHVPGVKAKRRRKLRKRYKVIEEKELKKEEVVETEVILKDEILTSIKPNERLTLLELAKSGLSDYGFKFV